MPAFYVVTILCACVCGGSCQLDVCARGSGQARAGFARLSVVMEPVT